MGSISSAAKRAAAALTVSMVTIACGQSVSVGGPPPTADTGTPARVDGGGTTDGGTTTPPPGPGISALRLSDGAGNTWRMTGDTDTATADLVSLPGHNAFWFAWSIFHSGTSIFDRDTDIAAATIAGDSECTVPCDQIAPACAGRDCIPSLQSPRMVSAGSDELGYLRDTDEVLGVITAEGPRAYPHNILWWHEIVNEDVGGQRFAITFCPLTGSGMSYDRDGFVAGTTVELGVSGSLYNSNLVMYDRSSDSFWSQMRNQAVFGSELAAASPLLPVHEMTWRAWRELHPDTLVVSDQTGHSRDYTAYPYGAYRDDHTNTFRATDPAPDVIFDNKDMTFGLFAGGTVRAYVWDVLAAKAGSRWGVVNDTIGDVPVAIAFDLDERYVHAFDRRSDGSTIELSVVTPD
ncbi:MAG: hypothetical protein DRJ42_03500 [Deltaproteobacteria bacterium]|nr:MAG: hypothetical protein DRJ42_03500 [Deltaproteobacteria bacterium]